MKQGPPIQIFISRFHKLAIAFNYEACDWAQVHEMKFYGPNASVNKFHSLGNSIYTVSS